MKNNVIILALFSALLWTSCKNANSGLVSSKENFTAQEALALANGDGLIIDVRERDEVADEAYDAKNVINIPLDSLEARINDIPKDKQVILACRSGRRSSDAFEMLKAKGFTNLAKLDGGIIAWSEAGLPTKTEEAEEKVAATCVKDANGKCVCAPGAACCTGDNSQCKKDSQGKCLTDDKSACCSGDSKANCKKDENGKCIPNDKSCCSDKSKCVADSTGKCCSK